MDIFNDTVITVLMASRRISQEEAMKITVLTHKEAFSVADTIPFTWINKPYTAEVSIDNLREVYEKRTKKRSVFT